MHFSENVNATDNKDLQYDRQLKLKAISGILNDTNSKYQPYSEYDCRWSDITF